MNIFKLNKNFVQALSSKKNGKEMLAKKYINYTNKNNLY